MIFDICLSHFSPQPLTPNLHAAEGKPFLAQILWRGPDRIDGVVDFRFFYVWFSKSFVFLQQKKLGAQALTSCINGCGVANRQVEQAASGVCGHPPFFYFFSHIKSFFSKNCFLDALTDLTIQ